MRLLFVSLICVMLSTEASAAFLVGAWQSDCQNQPNSAQGYLSSSPVDTFAADGTAELRVRVFRDRDCAGPDWNLEVLPCTYRVGAAVPGLANTRELDLRCELGGKIHDWYEIAEVTARTLRFGSSTGDSPAKRPRKLGSVYYRR